MDQAASARQYTMKNPLGASHLPEHVHVDPSRASREVVRYPCLGDSSLDGIGNQFLMSFSTGTALVGDGDEVAVFVIGVGVDARKRAHAAGRGPGPRASSVGNGDALASLD